LGIGTYFQVVQQKTLFSQFMECVMTQKTTPVTFFKTFCALLAASLITGCATPQPVIYSNGRQINEERLARDTAACRQRADQAVGLNQGRKGVAQKAAEGSVIGAVTGAVTGLFKGSNEMWERAGIGLATGGVGVAVKAMVDLNKPDKVYEEYVERCMKERGHDILGWR
jgi:hypothetical protein